MFQLLYHSFTRECGGHGGGRRREGSRLNEPQVMGKEATQLGGSFVVVPPQPPFLTPHTVTELGAHSRSESEVV